MGLRPTGGTALSLMSLGRLGPFLTEHTSAHFTEPSRYPRRQEALFTCLPDEETEAWREEGTCPGSPSWETRKRDWAPGVRTPAHASPEPPG